MRCGVFVNRTTFGPRSHGTLQVPQIPDTRRTEDGSLPVSVVLPVSLSVGVRTMVTTRVDISGAYHLAPPR
jgi:hypothetical protein